MDFMTAVTYPFDDADWLKKLGLAFLISLIPVVGIFVVYGWMLEITRRVKMNDPQPLPEWDEFGEYLRKGFMMSLGVLIYTIPVIIFALLQTVPAFLEMDEGVIMATTACCGCINVLLGLAISIFSFVAIIRYADTEEFSVFFAFSENWAILKDNIGDFGMAILFLIGFSVLAGLAASITFGLGSIAVIPLTSTFSGHLYGQLLKKIGSVPAAPAV